MVPIRRLISSDSIDRLNALTKKREYVTEEGFSSARNFEAPASNSLVYVPSLRALVQMA